MRCITETYSVILFKVFITESLNAEVFNKMGIWVIFKKVMKLLYCFVVASNNFFKTYKSIPQCSHLNKCS